ncbi:hypothetical protein Leryth_020453 [Lithospermum erythrorhizon]|uniref:Glutathione S-transferase n=1 Tax=Lithospermum erythrorhizon TaxID=34254 RepID=A0AAV3RWE9_LITER|nr:hypothetical protein Leryth_020453 [Lithospermum erythrorhizon]
MGSTENVKLLGFWPSPFVMRVKIALSLKSINYEFIEEPFGPKSELLLKSNPVHKKIPVFFHGDDKIIAESLVIVNYIDETWAFGAQILPSDTYDRAIARFWAAYLDDKWYPSLQGVVFGPEEGKKAGLEAVSEGLSLLEDAFKKISKGNKFFGGEKIGYLDIALGSYLGWLKVTEKLANAKLLDEEKTPGLFKWTGDFVAEDDVKEFMPETEKLVGFAQMIIELFKN